jgi:hypothetical protein
VTPTDYAQTAHAKQNRAEKARTLALFAWERGVLVDDLLYLEPPLMRRLARAAGIRRPPSDATWLAVADLLEKRETWDDQHQNDSRTVRPHAAERLSWLGPEDLAPGASEREGNRRQDGGTGADRQDREDLGVPKPTAGTATPRQDRPDGVTTPPPAAAAPLPAPAPSGWAALAALGPLPDGVPCAIPVAGTRLCGRPAIAWTPMRDGTEAARCAGHPPTGEDWGAGLAWAPSPCHLPTSCWCARHPGGVHQPWRPQI